MSRGLLGYVGFINGTAFKRNNYTGVATYQDTNGINNCNPTLINYYTLEVPSSYGTFGGGDETSYNAADLETGILIDGNANIGSNAEHYPGGYKLTIGQAVTLEFHIWAAGGCDEDGSSGGYTKYKATFAVDTVLGLYLPGWNGVPSTSLTRRTACWPDAGHGGTGNSNHGFSGGGSARVGPWYTTQVAMNASTATYYAIAGGGGGDHMHNDGAGGGGGSSGVNAAAGNYSAGGGGGGTQSAGGTGGAASSYGGVGQDGSKYQGGNGVLSGGFGGGGGGGGGYYGGGAGGTVYASGGGGSGFVDTSFSGYISGSTTAATSSGPPAGVGYNRPTNAGEGNHRGAIFIQKV